MAIIALYTKAQAFGCSLGVKSLMSYTKTAALYLLVEFDDEATTGSAVHVLS
jgi:hypothetical protein